MMIDIIYESRYDEDSDMLVLKRKGSKIQKSVSIGNMNIDFDTEGRVVGLQLLNASEVMVFPESVDSTVEFLKNIQNSDLKTKYFDDGSMVLIAVVKAEQNGEIMEGLLNTQTPAVTA